MAEWSEIFEKRLQTVLQDGTSNKIKGLDLTPPSMNRRDMSLNLDHGFGARQLPPPPKDPTAAFFETMRRQRGGQTSRYDSGGPVMTPAAQTLAVLPAFTVDTEASVKRLQESYSHRARDLHAEAMQRLDTVQDALEGELKDMAQQAEHFLSAAAGKQAQFSRPAEDWVVKIQTGGVKSALKNSVTQKDERVVDRIKAIREAADTLKADLARLWEQWKAAQKEASTVLQTISSWPGGDDADDIMSKAAKELDAAVAEAMKEMRENEKTFKKLIYAEECKIAQTMLSRQSKYD